MLILAQSDTTIGFLSKDPQEINRKKHRKISMPVLQTLGSFKSLSTHSRTPKKFRSVLRRASKTTFILANGRSYRIVSQDSLHHAVVEKFKGLYSSSANVTNKSYNERYALEQADLIIKDKRGFFEGESSHIIKLGKERMRKIR